MIKKAQQVNTSTEPINFSLFRTSTDDQPFITGTASDDQQEDNNNKKSLFK